MWPKLDKLSKHIQDYLKFIVPKISDNDLYRLISEELRQTASVLVTARPNFYIYGRSPSLSQALENALNLNPSLKGQSLKTFPFPQKVSAQSAPAATLTLQVKNEPPQHFSLFPDRGLLIGRRPGCDIQIPDQFSRVGGQQAEIKPILNSSPSAWQICDLTSRNGTFINRKQIQTCQTLETGDIITLAYPNASEKSPSLLFEAQSIAEKPDEFSQQLSSCDVLCLVVSSDAPLSAIEQAFIQRAAGQVSHVFLVIDTPRLGQDWQDQQLSGAAEISSWLKTQNLNQTVELVTLSLELFNPNAQRGTMIESGAQPDLIQFSQRLSVFTTSEAIEETLLARLKPQVAQQIAKIEKILSSQEQTIAKEIEQIELDLGSSESLELKESIRKAVRKASDERDKFFRQVKIDLDQSKRNLSDKVRKSSLPSKIRDKVNTLEPRIQQRSDRHFLQLHSSTANTPDGVNQELMYLCRSELSEWTTQEWNLICSNYGDGGWMGMMQRIIKALNVIPKVSLPDEFQRSLQPINLEKILKVSIVACECEVSHKTESLSGYLFKNTRSLVTGIISMLGIFGGAFFAKSNPAFAVLPLLLLLPVIVFLISSYKKDQATKLYEEGERLKERVFNYYQDLSRNLTDNISQTINLALDTEAQRLRESTETANETLQAHSTNTDKQQGQTKSRLTEYKSKQIELKRERLEFEKLKQL
jgi:hypothetical protein